MAERPPSAAAGEHEPVQRDPPCGIPGEEATGQDCRRHTLRVERSARKAKRRVYGAWKRSRLPIRRSGEYHQVDQNPSKAESNPPRAAGASRGDSDIAIL